MQQWWRVRQTETSMLPHARHVLRRCYVEFKLVSLSRLTRRLTAQLVALRCGPVGLAAHTCRSTHAAGASTPACVQDGKSYWTLDHSCKTPLDSQVSYPGDPLCSEWPARWTLPYGLVPLALHSCCACLGWEPVQHHFR